MTGLTTPSGRVRSIALAAIVALLAGIGVAAWQWRQPRPALDPSPGLPLEADATASLDADAAWSEADDEAIEQALRQQPGVETTPDKSRWVDVDDVEYADLDPRRREVFLRFANAERCTCGCGYTLAACRRFDATCETSRPLLLALLDSVRAGHITDATGIRPMPRRAAAAVAVDRPQSR